MQQAENQFIYSAPSRVRFNLTLILAAAVILLGVMQTFGIDPFSSCSPSRSDDPGAQQPQSTPGTDGDQPSTRESSGSGTSWLLIIVGLAVGGFSWFTTPRQYLIYSDSLAVFYGIPRPARRVHFSRIREAVNDRGLMGDPLRVYTANRQRIPIQVREPDEFHRHLQQALDDFRRIHPEYAPEPDPDRPPAASDDPAPFDRLDAPATDDNAAAPGMPDDQPPPASTERDRRSERRSRRRSLRDDTYDSADDDAPPRFS